MGDISPRDRTFFFSFFQSVDAACHIGKEDPLDLQLPFLCRGLLPLGIWRAIWKIVLK